MPLTCLAVIIKPQRKSYVKCQPGKESRRIVNQAVFNSADSRRRGGQRTHRWIWSCVRLYLRRRILPPSLPLSLSEPIIASFSVPPPLISNPSQSGCISKTLSLTVPPTSSFLIHPAHSRKRNSALPQLCLVQWMWYRRFFPVSTYGIAEKQNPTESIFPVDRNVKRLTGCLQPETCFAINLSSAYF